MSSFGIDKVNRLESWMQKLLNDKDIKVDINRVTHFAIFSGRSELVSYLVETKGAQLTKRDESNRSAVFYAVTKRFSDIEYVASKTSPEVFKAQLNSSDTFGATPLRYATICHQERIIEFCLFAGARPDDPLVVQQSESAFLPCDDNSDDNIRRITLLLALYGGPSSYRSLPLYIDKDVPARKLTTIDKLQSTSVWPSLGEKGGTWIHIPYTNVSQLGGNTGYTYTI